MITESLQYTTIIGSYQKAFANITNDFMAYVKFSNVSG